MFIWWNGTFEAYLVIILENISTKVFTIQSTKTSPLKINLLYSTVVVFYIGRQVGTESLPSQVFKDVDSSVEMRSWQWVE